MGERFLCFQILLSHNNNHLTARERERERGGGGELELLQLDSDQSHTLQRSTPMDLTGPSQSARTQPCMPSLYIWA